MAGPIPSRQPSFTSPPPTPSPRRPSALSGGANAEQRRARREQFRSFYGLQGAPKSQAVAVDEAGQPGLGEGSSSRKSGDPLDISKLRSTPGTVDVELIGQIHPDLMRLLIMRI